MSRTATGTVLSVQRVPLGDTLAAAALSGATTITVTDPVDFSTVPVPGFIVVESSPFYPGLFFPGGSYPSGATGSTGLACGTLSIGAVQYAYLSCDEDTGVIVLAEPLIAAAAQNDRVDVWDVAAGSAAVEYRALVELPGEVDNADAVDALVALPMVPLLPEGLRDPGEAETVSLHLVDDEWTVVDAPGKTPQIDGALTKPASIPKTSLGFTLPNGSGVAVSTTAPAGPNVGDIWLSVDATNSANNALYQWDGAAWQPLQIGTSVIAADAIVAGQIAAGALDAFSITTASLTAAVMSGHMVGAVNPTDPNRSRISGTDFLIDTDNGRIMIYAQTPTVAVNATGTSGSWTVPGGVTSVKIETWAAGGRGGNGGSVSGSPRGGGGGGGGEYASEPAYTVAPGDVIPYAAGVDSPTQSARISNVHNNAGAVACQANGGQDGHAPLRGDFGGPGGTGSVNSVHFDGGRGGATTGSGGGGGGSSAGSGAIGNTGGSTSGPGAGAAAAAPTDGGAGGTGGNFTTSTTPAAGAAPGGGGGGIYNGGPSVGAGGAGRVKITYYATVLLGSIATTAGTDALTGTAYPAGVMIYPNVTTDWNNANTPGPWLGVAGSQANSPDDTKTWTGEVYGRLSTGTLVQVVYRLSAGDAIEMWSRQFSSGGGWQPWHCIYADDGWHNLTLKAGFSDVGPVTLQPAYRAKAGIVYLRGYASGTFTASGTDDIVAAGGIPAGLRPANDRYVTCAANGVANAAFLIIRSDGSITVKSGATAPTWVSLAIAPWIGDV